jgi:glycosyltransferase involved in cell wall biosynthesis
MPVFNDARFIAESISCVLDQEFSDFELLISDNGSTDNTSHICETLATQESRIRYVRQPENRGASWNFRHVFEMARGEYFMWASSHDLLAASFAAKCIELLDADPTVVLAYARSMRIDGNSQELGLYPNDRLDLRGMSCVQRACTLVRDLTVCNMVYGVFRREVLSRLQLDRTCIGPDCVLLMEVAIEGAIAQIPEVLFFERRFRQGQTAKGEFHAQMLERLTGKRDPAALRWRFCNWYREYLRTILRKPLPLSVRVWLAAYLTTVFVRRFASPLAQELLGRRLSARIIALVRSFAAQHTTTGGEEPSLKAAQNAVQVRRDASDVVQVTSAPAKTE